MYIVWGTPHHLPSLMENEPDTEMFPEVTGGESGGHVTTLGGSRMQIRCFIKFYSLGFSLGCSWWIGVARHDAKVQCSKEMEYFCGLSVH